ncbi:MAG: glycosyltransferase family 39 protein [Methanobacteriaceae archaeon]|jgi:hypothetical protein|nr:glycosyltransferase family 39 protein [Methanobacteriaceae archaeon]
MVYNFKDSNLFYLTILVIFSVILIAYYINFNINYGIFCSDVFVYLLNALYFTGESIRASSTISLAPVVCFLTSLFFYIGIKDEIAIFIITGLFAILGNIGLFLLFRVKFNNILSLFGTILFMTFSINLAWLANGSIDIPAVSINFWTMLFTIWALNKKPKYFIWVFITFTLSFFIRPTVILFLPVIILYYLIKKDFIMNLLSENRYLKLKNYFKSEEFHYIVKGLIISALIFIFIYTVVSIMGSKITFIFQSSDAISGSLGSINDPAYNPNKLFYIENFLNFLSSSSTSFVDLKLFLNKPTFFAYGLVGILIVGFILTIYDYFNILKKSNIKKDKLNLLALFIAMTITILSFNNVSSVITIIFAFLTLLYGEFIFKKYEFDYLTLNISFLAWIIFNLIFCSYYDIKVDRYIIPSMVGVSYFIISSISLIQSKFQKDKIFHIAYVIMIIFLIISSFNFVNTFEDTDYFKNNEIMADYLKEYDDNYENESIGVYNVRPYSWYLETHVEAMSSGDPQSIDKSNITYYISNKSLNLENFIEVKNIGDLYLYKRVK